MPDVSFALFNPTGDGTDSGRDGILLIEEIVLTEGLTPDGYIILVSTFIDFSDNFLVIFAGFRDEDGGLRDVIAIDADGIVHRFEQDWIYIQMRTVKE